MRPLIRDGCGGPRRALAVALLGLSAAAGTVVAAADAQPRWNANCGGLDCRVERVPAAWQLLHVGRDLRTLKLAYESGGCRRGNGRARVTERASRIDIAVDQEEIVAIDAPDAGLYCPAILRHRLLRVRLGARIAGRPLEGGPRSGDTLRHRSIEIGGRVIPLVPRVLDLSARDAREVLVHQGFEVRRTGRRSGRVVAQSPRSGKRARGDIVRIRIGRRPPPLLPPLAITLRSLGARIEAPIGNWCGRSPEERSPEGLLGCLRAHFPGHPTKRRLPVREGGLLHIETRRPAGNVFIRLTEGIAEGGATKGRVGPDRFAHRDRGSGRRWRVRLPSPLHPAGGIAVVASYRYCATDRFACGHYYARIRPAGGPGRLA
jgi:hypothetical protein